MAITKAVAPPKPETPPNMVEVAGTQEQFQEEASTIASALGWEGEPHLVKNGITVQDAWQYVTKTLHEHFLAGARGEDQPSREAAYEHLAVDTEEEFAIFGPALDKAYKSGKGAPTQLVERVFVQAGANLTKNVFSEKG